MKQLIILAAIVAMVVPVRAENIQGIDIEFVTIGNPGNVGDTRTGTNPYGIGAVDYNYRIGKYEVTNAQWNAFTTVAGAPTGNPIDAYNYSAYFTGVQQPTNNVSWYEAAQFCNYLTSGNKSLGAYQLSTDGSITINRAAALSTYGTAYVIPTEDEWYKAAYFKADGSGYSTYANSTNTAPIPGVDTNYENAIGSLWNVGTGAMEQNGTFDMMGNVWEWSEKLIDPYFVVRGGSHVCYDSIGGYIRSNGRLAYYPYDEFDVIGFRVASIVPEPSSLLLLTLSGLLIRKR